MSLYNTSDNRRSWSILKDSASVNGGIRFITSNDGTYNASYNLDPDVSLPTNQWNHIAVEKEGNTGRVYQNGVCVGVNTNFPTSLYSNVNDNLLVGAGIATYIGSNGEQFTNGYIQDLRVYNGVARYKGGFDVPKHYSPVGIETFREVPDTCVNNFATLNPLGSGAGTFTDGTLTYNSSSDTGNASIGISTGNFYCEARVANTSPANGYIGIMDATEQNPLRAGGWVSHGGIAYKQNGEQYLKPRGGSTTTSSYGASYTSGDIIGIACDVTNNTVTFYKNGISQGNTSQGPSFIQSNGTFTPLFYGNTVEWNINFGQNPTFGNIAALNKNRINSSTADSVWHQSSNTGTHTDWTVSADGTELDVAVPSGHYARVKLRSADGTIDPKKRYLLSFKYTTGPANLGVQNDQGYMTAVDGSVSPNGLSSGNFYSFVVHGSSVISITGFTGSTYALDNVIVSEIDECYTDDSGKGKFHYQPPTGYLALCEDNLPTPAIADPGDYFKTVLWSGDGNTGRSIRGLGFKPDLVWIKRRNGASDHVLQDSVRGFGPTTKLSSSSTQHENDTNSGGSYGITDPQWGYLTSVDEGGFSLSDTGTADQVNYSESPYVAWCWKAGGAAVTNKMELTSQVSVNQAAGFIATYTTPGTATNFGHGLGKKTSICIIQGK